MATLGLINRDRETVASDLSDNLVPRQNQNPYDCALLDDARRLVKGGALIPPERNCRQQVKVYESQRRDAGLSRMHGLCHG